MMKPKDQRRVYALSLTAGYGGEHKAGQFKGNQRRARALRQDATNRRLHPHG